MSFYTSLNGLQNAQTDLSVISNNIANADTNGFKGSTISFADIISNSALTDPTLTVGLGSRVQAITQQFGLGSMQQTGNSLDLAINGDGFFVSRSPTSNVIGYTRVGAFSINGTGFVVDSSGNRVQALPVDAAGVATSTTPADAQVALTNSGGSQFTGVSVSSSGVITASYADGSTAAIGAVAMASFASETGLKQMGGATWSATGSSGPATIGQPGTGNYGALLSGTLEGSNVDLSSQLVGLVSAQQDFQANAKAIDTNTQTISTIINMRSQ